MSRELAAAEEALAKFASEIDTSSTVVPLQLDITDATSVKTAHAFIANYLKKKSLPGLDVLINNAGRVGTFEEVYAVNIVGTAALTEALRPLLNNCPQHLVHACVPRSSALTVQWAIPGFWWFRYALQDDEPWQWEAMIGYRILVRYGED
ncbi:hypothetical protein B0H17DRAFT_1202532 [Mycena rosella]|uniref:NAD(P)-binding protein n=1 Tax=Mycena rosella TaxID=1033263 RepID=A0AAD7GD87_MYCRO|nr:hypothetical protein B0H17DRAFT_1202532 [Mycena rosella]